MKALLKLKKAIRASIGVKTDTDFYSQGGEDAIVSNTFINGLGIHNGRYLDIGAFHPFTHSNTYILYRAGWSGFNIDPRPGSKIIFDRHRPGDVNIEAGIGSENDKLTYYFISDESTMNTFSRENLERMGILDQVTRTIEVPVFSLRSLADQYPRINETDYINIDAEGYELEILEGNDFARCSPKVISIEQNDVSTLSDVLKSQTAQYLEKYGYVPYAKNLILKTVSTVFYIKDGLLTD